MKFHSYGTIKVAIVFETGTHNGSSLEPPFVLPIAIPDELAIPLRNKLTADIAFECMHR